MKRFLGILLTVATLSPLGGSPAQAAESDSAAITAQLHRYEAALNASETASVMMLYADDAVFMPQNSLPAVGRDAVRAAYDHVFHTIRLNIRFEIDEVRTIAPDWAYARTRSLGTQTLLSGDGHPEAEGNQEIFVLHKEADGQWRFARYIFATTNPPQN